jgi:Nif-specific ferredoxin III
MDPITGLTRGGANWTPTFLMALNQKTCIGCGRCYKVCPRNVFDLIEREADDDSYDDDEDDSMVMSIANALDCIGCGSCARVCPKQCHTHQSLPLNA